MKFSITQENLNHSLATVSRIVGSRSTLPVLANIYLEAQANRVKLAATNLEMGITCWLGAKVETEGVTTVPAKLFSEYIHNLPSGNVELTTENDTTRIKSGGFDSKLNGIDASEFPSIPEVTNGQQISVAADTLKHALEQVVTVCSADDSRPVLTGVYLHTNNGVLYAVATDSYRLAEKRIMECEQEIAVIIPARSITELLRIISEGDNVTINVDENQISFVVEETELVSRLIDGQFPDYRQLIPEDIPTTAQVKTTELQNVAKVAGLFARENAGSVIMKVEEQTISVQSVANQVGENTSSIEAQVEGDPIEVSLNGRYILDALNAINSKEVTVGLTGKVNPCVIRPVDDDSYLHIIMPLRS